jgi:hypothetical protein
MKTTKEIFTDFTDKAIEYYDRKLIQEGGCLDLDHFHSSVLYAQNSNEHVTNPSAREKTLTYLYPLLKEEKLVAGRIRRRNPDTLPKSIDEVRGKPIFEDIPGTPEEIIEYIRGNWNNNPDFVEQFDCVFKLPEMDWPKIVD